MHFYIIYLKRLKEQFHVDPCIVWWRLPNLATSRLCFPQIREIINALNNSSIAIWVVGGPAACLKLVHRVSVLLKIYIPVRAPWAIALRSMMLLGKSHTWHEILKAVCLEEPLGAELGLQGAFKEEKPWVIRWHWHNTRPVL